MAEHIYQGDVGLEIVVDCGRDITGATGTVIEALTPSGAPLHWVAAIKDADDGDVPRCLRYVTKAGDLAEAGDYRLQPRLNLGGWTGHGRTVRLRVRSLFA